MNDQLNKTLNELGLSEFLSLFEGQDIDDSVLGDLSDADLKDIGIDKLGTRKKLLAAFGKPGGGGTATASVAEQSAPQRGLGDAPPTTATTPDEATKHSPWVNTLGMPFVPIPRFDTRFCIWPVRVQDYEAYCMASGAKFPEIPFPQESDHPIVGVSWNDAIEFCVWLTGKERTEGKIDEKTVYRLPTDLEWSAAVGLPHEPEATPAQRHLKAPGYPWGLRWPPPRDAGNYEHRRNDQLGHAVGADADEDAVRGDIAHFGYRDNDPQIAGWKEAIAGRRRLNQSWLSSWQIVDDHEFTSPVDTFKANEPGIQDLGGNVWEWCMDEATANGHKVLRGASFGLPPDASIKGGATEIDLGAIGWQRMSAKMPLENTSVYRSSFRLSENSSSALYFKIYGLSMGEQRWLPHGGFRAVLTVC